jgi:hypothetical protein
MTCCIFGTLDPADPNWKNLGELKPKLESPDKNEEPHTLADIPHNVVVVVVVVLRRRPGGSNSGSRHGGGGGGDDEAHDAAEDTAMRSNDAGSIEVAGVVTRTMELHHKGD